MDKLPVPAWAAGAICIPVSTQEKKHLARQTVEKRGGDQARHALRPGLGQRLARQAHEAQPRGARIHSSESGGGGRRENRPPRALPARRRCEGRSAELCGSSGPCSLGSLLSGPGAQSSYREKTSYAAQTANRHDRLSEKQQKPDQSSCPQEDMQDKESTQMAAEEKTGLYFFCPSSPERGKP